MWRHSCQTILQASNRTTNRRENRVSGNKGQAIEKAILIKKENTMDKIFENNQVTIAGEITSPFAFSHEVCGEGFYVTNVSISRNSGTPDIIPIMVSDRLHDVYSDHTGVPVQVIGQFRSYNRHSEGKSSLIVSVFVREIKILDELQPINIISLDGFLCKAPIYRQTPLGREIADLLIAVNRPYGKSDYIPCICWGRNAKFSESFEVGDRVQVWGRVQSREYQKRINDTDFEIKTAYEVSVSRLEYLGREEG
jgi:primosomal replication protein N